MILDVVIGNFSKYIDFTKFQYLGIDCVKSVIDENVKKYSKGNISFIHKSVEDDFIPSGYDFIILKDVIPDIGSK